MSPTQTSVSYTSSLTSHIVCQLARALFPSSQLMSTLGYTADVLHDAQTYSVHAGRTGVRANRIEKEDIEFAIQSRHRYEFVEAPPRDVGVVLSLLQLMQMLYQKTDPTKAPSHFSPRTQLPPSPSPSRIIRNHPSPTPIPASHRSDI